MAAAILRLTTGIAYVRSVSGTFTFASGSTAQFADGSAPAPSITFASDPDTGLYSAASNIVGVAAEGLGQLAVGNRQITLRDDSVFGWSASGSITVAPDTVLARDAANSLAQRNGTNSQILTIGAAGAATSTISMNGSGSAISSTRYIKKTTAIADNTATTVFTVTVPNANHAAVIKLRFLSSNGSTDAFESARCGEGTVLLTRTAGVTCVASAVALADTAIATVAAGATHTLAYSITAMVGAASATQTFTIQVTIDDSGNTGANQVVAIADLINAETAGVTIA